MHWFDTLAAVIIAYMAIMGVWRGFLREIFPALSIVGGGLCAAVSQKRVSSLMDGFVEEGLGREIAAYVIMFILVWSAVSLVGYGIRRLSDRFESATTLNRAAGFGMGTAKGALAMAIFAVVLAVAPSMRKDVAKKSFTGPVFIYLGDFTLELLSPGLAARLNSSGDKGIIERARLLKETAGALDPTNIGKGAEPDKPEDKK